METKELLEKLVKEVAAQNRLIALLLADKLGLVPNWDFLNKEERLERLKEESNYFVELVSK